MYYQHDGAPAHYGQRVRDWLSEYFPGRSDKGSTAKENTKQVTKETSSGTETAASETSNSGAPKSRKKRSILDCQERDNVGVDGAECDEFK
ncbi:hypothetical protein NQ317_006397 [Molorchus minor]|uniref:Uncharacterized protein n=1 Tax=Molorchus minor TaxID=1323400 RepID=A0ABQ9IZK9_9CUCU|nr:hypothetical protein NQ317_006397 [Molorchus minor]